MALQNGKYSGAGPPVTGASHEASRGERLVWYTVVVFAAAFMTALHLAANTPYKLTTFHQLVNFQAAEPFQHRILLPALVAAIQHILPLDEKLLFGVCEWLEWMALILVARRGLAMFEIGATERLRSILALTLLVPMYLQLMAPNLILKPFFSVDNGILGLGDWQAKPLFYYVYDLPAALLTLAMTLVLIYQRRAPSTRGLFIYLGLFVLATLNRETSAFMIPFFALLFYRHLSWRRLLLLLALQCAVFAAIQAPLSWAFADNVNPNAQLVGTQYESHFLLNLSILAQPAFLVTFLVRFAAGLWLPVLLWPRALASHLAMALLGIGAPLIFFALLGGIVREYRIFIELVPLIWLAALQVIASLEARS